MSIYIHELKENFKSFLVWTISIVSFLIICIFLYPQMKGSLGEMGDLFSSLGSFSSAFGMDTLSFGSLVGFYAVECGNILGLGSALYSSLLGIGMISKEEKGRYVEFLFVHPIARMRVLIEKYLSLITLLTLLHIASIVFAITSIAIIGEVVPFKELFLMHGSFYFLSLEIASICFGLSAFFPHASIGLGLGLSLLLYFMNIVANISSKVSFLSWITPFGYTNGSDIVNNMALEWPKIIVGLLLGAVLVILGAIYYDKRDLKC